MKYIIALDVGGTKIAAALIENKRIIKKIKIPTQAKKGKNFVFKRICSVISLLLEAVNKKQVKGIGIGLPGLLDCRAGTALLLPNIPSWRNVPIKKMLERKFKLKVKIENDTNCAALAESKFFKSKNLICLTLGTGVGGGIIIDGKIYSGQGLAGEFGHMSIDINGPKNRFGSSGTLEEYVSARGIERIAKKYNLKLKIMKLEEKARKGNKKAIAIYREAGKYLGIALANIVNIFNPETIVISGGISNAGDLILKPAIREMKKRAFNFSQKNLKVVVSKLQENAGLLGAASLFN